jgi:transposase InsO family protein
MSHRNARLTVHGRLLIVQRYQANWKQAHIAAAMGVSRKCVKTWIDRYAAEGEPGLSDRSSRPHSMPTRTSPQVEEAVLAARVELRAGQDVLAPLVGVPARTVGRILRRHAMPYLRECDPLTGAVIRSSKSTAVRYERDHPGDLVHMDVKKLGRIPDGGGWKAHGVPATISAKNKRAPIGYDYIHSLVDDHSRLAYSEVLPDAKAATCAAFLRRGATYFADHGIPAITQLMTDNALAYRHGTAIQHACADLGIRQLFIKPHCPWQNGKVERLNRTLATEWAYRQVFASNQQRTDALAPWLEYYNTQRRHSSLGGTPPITRLQPT